MRPNVHKGPMLGRVHFFEIMATLTVSFNIYYHYEHCFVTLYIHISFVAAHIELLGIANFSTCTAVNVRIIQCWEIEDNTCPQVNTSLTIPTCDGCPNLRPLNVGDYYLIAGVRQKISGKRRLLLPSNKETGLFSPWDDVKYASIADWIQYAIHGI